MPPKIWYLFDQRLQNAFNIWENGLDFDASYVLRTDDMGTVRFGVSGTELLRYTTASAAPGSPLLDTKAGKNSPRYPSAEMQARFTLGWAFDAFSSTLSVNYQHPTNGAFATYPYNLAGTDRGYYQGAEGQTVFTSAGNVHTPGFVQFNLAVNYALPSGLLAGNAGHALRRHVGVRSISTTSSTTIHPTRPVISANGYTNGNPVGRSDNAGREEEVLIWNVLSSASYHGAGFFFVRCSGAEPRFGAAHAVDTKTGQTGCSGIARNPRR